jgi:hypothetical protein
MIANNVFDMFWKEAILAEFKVSFWNLSGEAEEIMKTAKRVDVQPSFEQGASEIQIIR